MAKRRTPRRDPPAITTPHTTAVFSQSFPWAYATFGLLALLAGVRLLRGPTTPSAESLPAASDRAHDAGASEIAVLGPADLVTEVRTLAPNEPDTFRIACRSAMDYRRWVFPGMSANDARSFVTGVVEDPTHRAAVLSTLQCDAQNCAVLPSLEAVESLSTASRVRLYRELVRTTANFQATNAFRRSTAEGPFSHIPGMPEAARPWLDRVEFSVDGRRVLYDATVLCAHVPEERDQIAMFAALQSNPTITASLRADLDPERVARSFRPSARDEVRARCAAARSHGEPSVPLRALLPAAIRERLDRFPDPAEVDYNCFWTALRFDVSQPAWPLTAPGAMRAALPRTHRQVLDGSLYFGDVLLFADRNGVAIHAVNYLVGGLVLTKNGPGRLQPWRLTWLNDITVAYPAIAEVTVWRADR